MATDQNPYPYRGYNFIVEVDGLPRGAFSEVSGLSAEITAVEYREGTDKQQNMREMPGLAKFSNLLFKRGYTDDKTLWQWYVNIYNGQPDRRNVTVVLLNERREQVLRWNAENAWIRKIEGPSFKASGNEVAMESMELVHEGLTLEA